ncbi:PhaM family polyhydroxyalkanoate granule multifunctional regulatory protein [Comamonas jiangduensis]|uniref:PhaM family polyhydroxyalkanoate granule multifunctional regulatory protein n=1 Tax=Comamonas jiangduensis TaxID=1194168 RepID=UPI0024E04F89|nr:PhaM family polyhydroxyalkanoate granule multifunctional regulatory protein [Comamonas jiangduensis]
MTDSSAFGFGKFIPGFDFLQNLGKSGATPSGLPPFSHWVAPTVSVEEIDKRIEELKAVHFWLEQNSKALAATVQALEVQKMTLSTLKGMNVNLSEMAKAFPFAAAATAPAKNPLTDWPMSAAAQPAEPVAQPSQPQPQQAPETPKAQAASSSAETAESPSDAAQTANMATAMQWWGALTQQFQHIAQQAMQDPAQQQAMLKATQMSTDFAKTAVKTASDLVRQAVAQAKPQKSAAAPASKAAATARQSAPAQKKPAASPPAAAKKVASAAKKAPAAAAKTQRVAAKKPTVRKPRTA